MLPEATDILAALGIGSWLVPAPRAAGSPLLTWEPLDCQSPDALAAARPTLIFASETSAGGVPRRLVRRLIAPLRPRPAVYALEPRTVGDILSDVKTIGDATGRQSDARRLIVNLRTRIDRVALRSAQRLADGVAPRVACIVGKPLR